MTKSNQKKDKPKVLIFTNIFPSAENPNVGFYVYEQVQRLRAVYDIKIMMAKPSGGNKKKDNSKASVKVFEGIEIFEPQYVSLPKIGVFFNGYSYYRAIEKIVELIYKEFPFVLIIAYWTYPDGYAAVKIAKKFQVPVILRPRGSDINVYADNPVLRFLLKRPLKKAYKIIPVSNHLKERVLRLGINQHKICSILNGINAKDFFVMDKNKCRQNLDLPLDHKLVLFVGNFIAIKGIEYFIEAIRVLDQPSQQNLSFIFLGSGPLADKLQKIARELKFISIRIIGDIAHNQLRVWMNASDLLCLPSLHEGCPNVVIESLACGLPVVASNVGGIPELINNDELGILVPAKDERSLADAIEKGLIKKWNQDYLLNRVKSFSWDNVVEKLQKECDLAISSAKKD